MIIAIVFLGALGFTSSSDVSAGGGIPTSCPEIGPITINAQVEMYYQPMDIASANIEVINETVTIIARVRNLDEGKDYILVIRQVRPNIWLDCTGLTALNANPPATPIGGAVVVPTNTQQPFATPIPGFVSPTATIPVFGTPNPDQITVQGEGAVFAQGSVLTVPYGALVSQWNGPVGVTRETVLRLCLNASCAVNTSIGAGDWRYYVYTDGTQVDPMTLSQWIGTQAGPRFTFANQVITFDGIVVWNR